MAARIERGQSSSQAFEGTHREPPVATQFLEGGFVHAQQRPQFLICGGFGHHAPAVAQGHREAPHRVRFPFFGE
jgi:hypothetical protein